MKNVTAHARKVTSASDRRSHRFRDARRGISSSAVRNSAADCHRSAGSFANAFAITGATRDVNVSPANSKSTCPKE
jgi:hypothetical protein